MNQEYDNNAQWTNEPNQTPQWNAQSNPEEKPRWTYEAPPQYTPEKPKKKGWTAGKVIALALCCSLVGGILGTGGTILATGVLQKQEDPSTPTPIAPDGGDVSNILEGLRENSVIEITNIDTSKRMTAAEVYAANVNSTVGITTSVTTNYWGYQTTSAASGSGFVFSDDGYILTNHHVIEDSDSITVRLYNGESYDATLIGYDAGNDVAVLKIEAEGLVPVVLGDSGNMNVGDSVVAIGNPLGELTFSLTAGTVSAMNRQVTMSNGATMNLIQTDCAINSGNSGGALFNLYGEVVGITNAKYSSNSSGEASIDNIGFAIPINTARAIAESIIEKGYISKPYIGVSLADVSADTQSYGLPQGAAVKGVVEDSPAEKAGLQVNDIITHVGDQELTGSNDLVQLVSRCKIGDVLQLTIFRQGQTMKLELTVGEQIQQAIEEEKPQEEPSNGGQMPSWMYPFFW